MIPTVCDCLVLGQPMGVSILLIHHTEQDGLYAPNLVSLYISPLLHFFLLDGVGELVTLLSVSLSSGVR